MSVSPKRRRIEDAPQPVSESEPESSDCEPSSATANNGGKQRERQVIEDSQEPEEGDGQRQDDVRVADSEEPGEQQLQLALPEEPVDELAQEAWASFADEYYDMVEQLPLEVQRALRLILEMERDTAASVDRFKTSLQDYLNVCRPALDPALDLSQTTAAADLLPGDLPTPLSQAHLLTIVTKNMTTAGHNAGDKYSLASTLYETVDRHIQRLDADLTRLLEPENLGDESEGGSEAAEEEDEPQPLVRIEPAQELEASTSGDRKRRKSSSTGSRRKKKKANAHQPSADLLATLQSIPATADEPRYCYCGNVAMGEMVACDNEDCSREWFHLDCVGLTEAPAGDWYCNPCSAASKAGLIRSQPDPVAATSKPGAAPQPQQQQIKNKKRRTAPAGASRRRR